jgi:GNAT superfamily N-acetyltransferase
MSHSITDDRPEFHVRTATPSDITHICNISASATTKFATIPALSDLAEDREEELQVQNWLDQGKIYLAESAGSSVGFIAAYPVDSAIYIAEVSVEEGFQGQGVGGMLLNAVKQWACIRCRDEGFKSGLVSLKTYADVPWNGPWYRKHGFKEVDPAAVSLSHVEMAADDKTKLERPGFRRCCMLWESDTTSTAS